MKKKGLNHIRRPSSFSKSLFIFLPYASAHLPLYMQASQHPRNKSAPPSQPELSEHRSFSEDACSFLRRNHLSARLFSVIVHEHVHFRAVLIIYYNTYCILDISVFDSSRNFFSANCKNGKQQQQNAQYFKFLKIILFCAFLYFSVT